jgi:hypothetical protein
MAIDTAEKRRAVAGIGIVIFGPGVTPNATPDQEWRQEVGWGYPGILAGEAELAVATSTRIPSEPRIATIPSMGHSLGRLFVGWADGLS